MGDRIQTVVLHRPSTRSKTSLGTRRSPIKIDTTPIAMRRGSLQPIPRITSPRIALRRGSDSVLIGSLPPVQSPRSPAFSTEQHDKKRARLGSLSPQQFLSVPSPSPSSPMTSPETMETFLPQGFRRRRVQPRLRALNKANTILDDIGYYNSDSYFLTPEDQPGAAATDLQDFKHLKYKQYKALLNRKGPFQRLSPPPPPSNKSMEGMMCRRSCDEALRCLVAKTIDSPEIMGKLRRTIMSWQMKGELQAIVVWVENMMRTELITKRAHINGHKVKHVLMWWYFFKPLLAIGRWKQQTRQHKKQSDREKSRTRATKVTAASKFASAFLQAVDDDADGGLSLYEMKAAELGQTGSSDPRFAKASIWLMNFRNFQKYDTRGIGIIEEKELVKAMEVFLREYWKYDGSLW